MRPGTVILLIFSSFQFMNCYRILLITNIPSPSHYILLKALAKGLVIAGHNVTMISPFKNDYSTINGTYREIFISGAYEAALGMKEFLFELEQMNAFQTELSLAEFGARFTELALQETKVQELLRSKEEFDVVILVQCLNDALKAIADHYNAPLIMFGTMSANSWMNPVVANPAPPSYIPEMILTYGINMNFWQKIVNFVFRIFQDLHRNYWFLPAQNEILKKYFQGAPDLHHLYHNVTIFLINSHESINQAVPHVPSMIQIGGFHINPPKKLPVDVQRYLDESTEGVIYFSMGSNIKPSQMKNETLKALIKAFGKLKQTVLWKWDEDAMWNKPTNVKISKWFPQSDVLAHPNVKLFITHGGLLSLLETVYHGVPILAFPIFADQKLNSQVAEDAEIGLKIYYSDITEERLTEALHALLDDPKYRTKAKRRSSLFHDRPIKPLDLAIYWIEYVARYKNAGHLRVEGLNLTWYEYLSLDVVVVLLFAICFVCYASYLTIIKMAHVFLVTGKKVKSS